MKESIVTKSNIAVIGAICGDILGSYYEFRHRTKDLNMYLYREEAIFTDDTVCTIAMADALLNCKPLDKTLRDWCRRYINSGYGGYFRRWIRNDELGPYGSWGNGSAMRVSAAGQLARSLQEARELAGATALITHNHPEGIKGAESTAAAIYMALNGASKDEIRDYIETEFGYDLHRKYEDIQPTYKFEVSCQKSVPESIISFLESIDYEDAVRHAIALGGDADTQGAITGSIAAAFYGTIPVPILNHCLSLLPNDVIDILISLKRHNP